MSRGWGPKRAALAALRQEHDKRRRWRGVVLRYSRPEWVGGRWEPVRCANVRTKRGGKVVFDTQEAAEQCATELFELGATRLKSYPCPRSELGEHFHLTKDGPAERAADHAARSEFEALKRQVSDYLGGVA